MKCKVSDVVADFLAGHQIRHVFGIIGSGNAHLFDSITRKGYTEIVCVHNEQAAIMAMQTYYRITGTVSATLLTTGAGSTNGVTGVVSAWMDSIPGLILSGNENSRFTTESNPLRIWGIQGYNSTAMVEKVTKYAQRIMEPNAILMELSKAYSIAKTGRPGPVWLDIPMNIQAAPVETEELRKPEALPTQNIGTDLTADSSGELQTELPALHNDAKKVLKMLSEAKRPLLWLGHGIRLAGGVDLLPKLLEVLNAPALVSWAGIDMIASDHPQVMGRAGVYGQRSANFILQNCDFILAIGTRLAIPQVGYDLTEFARAAQVVVVDIDPLEAKKHGTRIELPIVADAKVFIQTLLKTAEAERFPAERAGGQEWYAQCRKYQEKFPWIGPEHEDQEGYINSYPFMAKLNQYFKPDQVVVTDMGTALLSGHQVLKFKKGQRLMTSTGLGEMGYGLPAAIGASFARDQGEVLCLNCDGGMMLNLQELQTIAHHQLPIKIIIFNNDGYLMIKHTQKSLFEGRYSGTDKKSGVTCPDFSKLAQAFDFPSYQIRTWDDMKRVMPLVQEHTGPVICEVFTHPEQLFVPKLGLAPQKDGTILSPPLEDLLPFISREDLREAMIIGIHPKSEKI